MMKRAVITLQPSGYKEVSLEFRKLRTAALEAAKVQERSQRIVCPVLDAARTTGSYGKMALASCDQAGLEKFAEGIHLPASKLSNIAYMSGPFSKIARNKWNKTFDDSEVNTGFVKSLKHGVHTNIIGSGQFDQREFDGFVWNLFPELKETSIDNVFLLESSQADSLFVTSKHLEQIMEFNESKSQSLLKGVGSKISRFEMEKLLLGRLGQPIHLEGDDSVRAISLRDLHDLYKYGVFPALVEEGLLKEGLIEDSSLAMSGQ